MEYLLVRFTYGMDGLLGGAGMMTLLPICSMHGIFTYIWVIFRANVGKYSSTMEHMG